MSQYEINRLNKDKIKNNNQRNMRLIAEMASGSYIGNVNILSGCLDQGILSDTHTKNKFKFKRNPSKTIDFCYNLSIGN